MSDLVWAAEHDYLILGTRFRVRTTHRGDGATLSRLLEPFNYGRRTGVRGRNTLSLVRGDALEPPEPGAFVTFVDRSRLDTGTDLDGQVANLLADLNRMAIEECPAFAVHAGVVSINGRGVAFPAESGGGKTTLTAACLQRGFNYASDEALVIDVETGRALRYPKPLALTRWSRARLNIDDGKPNRNEPNGERLFTASELAGDLSDPEFDLGHVVLAEYGHQGTTLAEAPAHDAMAALLRLSFNHYKHGERAFRLAADLANRVQAWRLNYGDPSEAANLMRRTFAGMRFGALLAQLSFGSQQITNWMLDIPLPFRAGLAKVHVCPLRLVGALAIHSLPALIMT